MWTIVCAPPRLEYFYDIVKQNISHTISRHATITITYINNFIPNFNLILRNPLYTIFFIMGSKSINHWAMSVSPGDPLLLSTNVWIWRNVGQQKHKSTQRKTNSDFQAFNFLATLLRLSLHCILIYLFIIKLEILLPHLRSVPIL